jgi:hypothetical protein
MLSPAINVDCLPFKLVSNSIIFVPTLLVPYNKLIDAVIVGAVIVVEVLPVIFPQVMDPILILVDVVSDACLLVSNSSILNATLVLPYTQIGAVIVVPVLPVILPELIVRVVILLVGVKSAPLVAEIVLPLIVIFVPATNVDCFPSNIDKIELMLSPTFITPVSSSTLNIDALISPSVVGDVVVFVENGETYIEFKIILS